MLFFDIILYFIFLIAILPVFILLALIMVVLKIGLCAWRSFYYEDILSTVNSSGINISTAGQRNRLRSLDTFRGYV